MIHDRLRINDLNEPVIESMPIDICVAYKKVCRNILVEIDGGKMK